MCHMAQKGMINMANMNTPSSACGLPLAYAYVPRQIAEDTNLYDAETGLIRGTIFPPLDLPLGVYGKQFVKEDGRYE